MQPIAIGMITADPNSSTPITVHASGVFVAPANTATKPIPAIRGTGTPSGWASEAPRVAPITNSGVTSPPWNPEPSVTAVNTSFSRNAMAITPTPPASDLVMSGRLRPRYSRLPTAYVSPTTRRPPINGRNGAQRTVVRNAVFNP